MFLLERRGVFTVKQICRVLHLSESGHYCWLRNRAKQSSRQLLAVKIEEFFAEHPDNRNYGVNRIRLALKQAGTDVIRRTVYRVMKERGWLHKKHNPHGITKSTTEIQEKENLLKRDFSAEQPLRRFLTDITEVQCADRKLYVSPIMDCFNGEIVALEMRHNMKKELCIDTVRQLRRRVGIFCVSVFRQNQEYHVINVHDGAYFPCLRLFWKVGTVCAPVRRECRHSLPETLLQGNQPV